ncbi:MAG: extracellular solute-binding protein [Ruminococcus sp.]|nr:extracellular solute-binding protein [Ruminococcus sp.]
MKKLKTVLAGLAAISVLASSAASCQSRNSSESGSSDENTSASEEETSVGNENVDINGQTIVWLADYDINPEGDEARSVALSLFEDVYGAKVEFVQAEPDEMLATLDEMILAGDEVDMFPYAQDTFPNGVLSKRFEPLDPYFGMMGMEEEGLWDDMSSIIDMFAYNVQHYVVPFSVSDPLVITYSRNIMNEEGLDDPYKLYLDGKWDQETFVKMMESYVAAAPEGETRYGINGWYGQELLRSTGCSVVTYDGSKLANNIDAPEIEKAVLLAQDIASKKLCNPAQADCFPNPHNTLFFAMGSWSLGASNAKNPNSDLMVVPFPKLAGAEKNRICCDYDAKMLVKNSTKGDAVAAYIKCERVAASQEEYRNAARQQAVVEEKTAGGKLRSFVTEEQYDALQSYLEECKAAPVFDFAYGMGEKMNREGEYNYETRGVINNMNNVMQAMLEGDTSVGPWAELREEWSDIIDGEVGSFNAAQ